MGKAKRAAVVAGDGRTERLEVRVSAAELAAMRAAAERDGAPLAVWARRALRVAAGLLVVALAEGDGGR